MGRIATQLTPVYDNIVDLLKFADVGISDIAIIDVESPTGSTKELRFIHSACDDPFELNDESAGTRTWLTMVTMALLVMAIGGTLVVDEIDRRLHPRLTARLMALFQDETTNPNHAQLVCTTHDTTLLSPILGEQVLTRDQVWFTEKSDFSPRKGENIERRYLGGSYGAVPRIVPEDLMAAMRGRTHGAA
jgi:AAA15 family ATPase/GTPase